jgi:hypothetical protein
MSFIQRIIEALDARLWKFIRIVHSSNHDYPYHDYVTIDNSQGSGILEGVYAVGSSNVDAHGDQSKRFVSKRANMWYEVADTHVHFNDSRNVPISFPPIAWDAEGEPIYYEKEFYTNIAAVYYSIVQGDILHMYFEGVLPEEARDAE